MKKMKATWTMKREHTTKNQEDSEALPNIPEYVSIISLNKLGNPISQYKRWKKTHNASIIHKI
jgi:hypothetical protein